MLSRLDGTGRVASFTPAANLALNTTYTATITTGAAGPHGEPWFRQLILCGALRPPRRHVNLPVPLGSAANFDAVAGSTITNTGPTTIAGGDLGFSPGSAVTGFPPGTLISPAVMHITDPTAAQGQLDLTIAYNYAANLPGAAALARGLERTDFHSGLVQKCEHRCILSVGNVTLDAQGNANAVFIFQIAIHAHNAQEHAGSPCRRSSSQECLLASFQFGDSRHEFHL